MNEVRRAIQFSVDLDPFVFRGEMLEQAWPIVLRILPGWKNVSIGHINPGTSVIDLDEDCSEPPNLDPVNTAYDIVNRLRLAVLEAREDRLCLHAGGIVTSKGRAILYAGPGLVGKSTISAGLASLGLVCVGDDRVYIDDVLCQEPNIVSMGLAQKIRRPLPDTLPSSMRRAIDRRQAAPIGEMTILNWDEETQLTAGSTAALQEIWILDRSSDTGFDLKKMDRGPAARYLLELSEIGSRDLTQLVKTLNALTQSVPVNYVSFSDSLEVITELEKA